MADPDPRPPRRVIDRDASKRKLLIDPLCRSCGERASNTHHLIGKAQCGDDDVNNLIPLCGNGSMGCHGALHGNPFVRRGRRWVAQDVRLAIGLGLRPSEYAYVVEKLSPVPAAAMLANLYYVRVDRLYPFRMAVV